MPADVPAEVLLSFIGQVGKFHPRRTALCRALVDAGLPLQVRTLLGGQARLAHAQTRVNLNCSLNGDLNLRVFEVLQSGGCLLTDRLSPESGLDLLLAEGEHFAAFGAFDECIAMTRALLADAERARRIARNGKSAYEALLAPEQIARDFFALVERGAVRPEFDVGRDSRLLLARERRSPDLLRERIRMYETLQQIHAKRESTRVLITPGVDPRLIADLADLVRLDLVVDLTGDTARVAPLQELLQRADVAGRVRIVAAEGDAGIGSPQLLLGTGAEWDSGVPRPAVRSPRPSDGGNEHHCSEPKSDRNDDFGEI